MHRANQICARSRARHPGLDLQQCGQRWNIGLSSCPFCNLNANTFVADFPLVARIIEASQGGDVGVIQLGVRVKRTSLVELILATVETMCQELQRRPQQEYGRRRASIVDIEHSPPKTSGFRTV
jgi:hypothetical protein